MRSLLAIFLLLPFAAHGEKLTVFAPDGMSGAMQDIGTLWDAAGHQKIAFSFAASTLLAQQIAHGAPAALFISADTAAMDGLARKGAIIPASRTDLAGNDLVLVEPGAKLKPVDLNTSATLLTLIGTGRLAIGDPAHVPEGIYARQALSKLGLWDKVKVHLALAQSARTTLQLVESGEAPAGIALATDVKNLPSLGVAGTFPPDSHDPIRYPVALTKTGDTKEGRALLAFLHSDQARDVFQHYGFTSP